MSITRDKIITTSWDDGHPLDFRLAELLDKYGVTGTFYIPKTNAEHEVINEAQVRQLASSFEIGGHTLNHVRLNIPLPKASEEIYGCRAWLEQLTGVAPQSFCFPGGVFSDDTVRIARSAGFDVLRTTELLSTAITGKQALMPTTVQLYEGSAMRYTRHLAKRLNLSAALLWAKKGFPTSVARQTERYLEHIDKNGGCFHLWGHSWELEEQGSWNLLEQTLKQLQGLKGFKYLQNKELLNLHS